MPFKVFEGQVPGPFTGKFVTVGNVEARYEDSRMAMIVQIDDNEEYDNGMFVRIQSWDETKQHADASRMLGKRVRVTVEIIE